MRPIAFFVWLAFAGLAVAGTRDPGVSDQRHIDYGKKFSCVGRLECHEKATGRLAAASCVAISPRWVVTAAHVVDESERATVIVSGTRHRVVELRIHEGFTKTKIGCCDVAVAKTEGDIGLDFYPGLYSREDEEGRVVSICGYGLTGTFDTGHSISDEHRRAGSNIVDYVASGGLLVCSVGEGVATELEFLISPGDSGGGLFIGSDLAGINSVVMARSRTPSSRRGEESGHVRVSTHKEWILAATDER